MIIIEDVSPERYQRVVEIFQAAIDLPLGDRSAFITSACKGDDELRHEVEIMLAGDGAAASVLVNSPARFARTLLEEISGRPLVGKELGGYRILSLLGSGGMGEVYLAEDLRLGRKTALKLLPPEYTANAERLRRFEQEARALSALNHPNIVTIYSLGHEGALHFLATEWIDGLTLRQWIGQSKRPLSIVLDVALQTASALAAAHSAGIIHRDIKPENMLIRHDGLVKVVDFGLAKLAEHTEESPVEGAVRTRTGMIMGTPSYMSPEQAQGLPVDARSDIFSFGVVLHELLAGQRPFGGATDIDTLHAILHEKPAPLGEDIPAGLRALVEKALEKAPADRYQSMGEMAAGLRRLTRTSPDEQPARWRRRGAWASLTLAMVVLLGGFFAWRQIYTSDTAEPLRAVPLITGTGVQSYPSISPDGNYVVFTWTGPKHDNPDIWVQQIRSAGAPLRLTTDAGNDYNPVWSPDGRWIAFLRSQSEAGRSELRLIPPLGGPERKIAEIRLRGGTWVAPPYITWCPESDCLVVTNTQGEGKPDALFVISPETGEKKALTHPQFPEGSDTSPAISPDGRWLVFRRMPALYASELYALPIGPGLTSAGEPRKLTAMVLDAAYPAWAPGSKKILFSARGSLWRLGISGGAPARLPFVGQDGIMPVVSRPQAGRPARLVYVRSFVDFNIRRIDVAAPGSPATDLPVLAISSTRNEGMPQISPDGRRVAFWSDRSGDSQIWVADPDGSNAVKLTSVNAFGTGYPHWSPDSQTIAFHSSFEVHPQVYVIAATGGKPRNITSSPAVDVFPSFSHDGQWIYFTSNRTGEYQVWKIPATGGIAVPVTTNTGYAALESPDGKWIYYVETLDKPSPLWRAPVSGGASSKVLDRVYLANFGVIEKGIYYIDEPAGSGGVYYLDRPTRETRLEFFDFATRKSMTVARDLGTVDVPIAVSPDGRMILFPRQDSSVDDLMLVENFR